MSKQKIDRILELNELGKKYSDANVLLHAAIAEHLKLAPADHKYLGIILDKGPMTAGELSQLTGLSTGAVTGLVDRLGKKKLVERKADKTDRRRITIVPNYEKMELLFSNVFGDMVNRMSQELQNYSEVELDTIKSYLTTMIEVMEDTSVQFKKRS